MSCHHELGSEFKVEVAKFSHKSKTSRSRVLPIQVIGSQNDMAMHRKIEIRKTQEKLHFLQRLITDNIIFVTTRCSK